MYRQYHAAGRQHAVRGDQGRGQHTGKNHTVYALVLCGHFAGPDAGNLRAVLEYGSSHDCRIDVDKQNNWVPLLGGHSIIIRNERRKWLCK